MSWGRWKAQVETDSRDEASLRHKERLAWAQRTYPDLPPLLVLQSLPRLREWYGRNGVTHELIREAVERKC